MTVGRGVWFKKMTVQECWNLDMVYLRKRIDFGKVCLTAAEWKSSWGKRFKVYIVHKPKAPFLIYYFLKNTKTGQPEEIVYKISWEATPCNYGGFRYWFYCPNCHSRRRVLYLPPRAKYFACRKCYNLCYESQQEGKSMWWTMFKAINDLPKWEDKYYRVRSPKKKTILQRKIARVYGGMQNIVGWGRRYRRRNR